MISESIGSIDTTNSLKNLRIAYIFNHPFFLGGGEISFYELIRGLDKDIFEPVVIVPGEGEVKEKISSQNTPIYVCPLPPLKKIAFGSPLYALFNLKKLIRNKRIDAIHANGSRACLYAGLAGRMLGVPVTWHVRESLKDLFFYDLFLGLMASAIICVSKSVESKRFGRFNSRINKKTFVVYNGVDTIKFKKKEKERQRLRRELCIRKNETLFGIVGNVIPRKGQDFFLKGLAKAKEMNPDLPARGLIVGRPLDIAFNRMVHQLTLEMNLKDEVIFRNYSEEIIEIFSALDVFALPSKSEGFSRSLLEAMSSSLPVLATKIGETEEAVIDGENAILVDFNDFEKVASCIVKLSEDES